MNNRIQVPDAPYVRGVGPGRFRPRLHLTAGCARYKSKGALKVKDGMSSAHRYSWRVVKGITVVVLDADYHLCERILSV